MAYNQERSDAFSDPLQFQGEDVALGSSAMFEPVELAEPAAGSSFMTARSDHTAASSAHMTANLGSFSSSHAVPSASVLHGGTAGPKAPAAVDLGPLSEPHRTDGAEFKSQAAPGLKQFSLLDDDTPEAAGSSAYAPETLAHFGQTQSDDPFAAFATSPIPTSYLTGSTPTVRNDAISHQPLDSSAGGPAAMAHSHLGPDATRTDGAAGASTSRALPSLREASAADMPSLHTFTNALSTRLPMSEAPLSGGATPHMPMTGPPGARMAVSVHTPHKAIGPSKVPGVTEAYTLYNVTTTPASALGLGRSMTIAAGAMAGNDDDGSITVQRRFRDVVALAEMLQVLHPGFFIPPRPSRNAVEARRMQASFIEERRAATERFLNRLACHPVLAGSEALSLWLSAPPHDLARACPEWVRMAPSATAPGFAKSTAKFLAQVVGAESTVPSPLEVVRPPTSGGDLYRVLHERAAALSGVLAGLQPSPAEQALRDQGAELEKLQASLVNLSKASDKLIGASSKAASALGKAATALETLGAVEKERPLTLGSVADAAAPAAVEVAADGLRRVSQLQAVAVDAGARHLAPLNDWLAAMPSALAALQHRQRCLLTVATLERDEARTRTRLAELERTIGGPRLAKRLETMRFESGLLVSSLAAARDEYERVLQRNAQDVVAFKASLASEMRASLREFALVQLAASQKAAAMWTSTAEALAGGR